MNLVSSIDLRGRGLYHDSMGIEADRREEKNSKGKGHDAQKGKAGDCPQGALET